MPLQKVFRGCRRHHRLLQKGRPQTSWASRIGGALPARKKRGGGTNLQPTGGGRGTNIKRKGGRPYKRGAGLSRSAETADLGQKVAQTLLIVVRDTVVRAARHPGKEKEGVKLDLLLGR